MIRGGLEGRERLRVLARVMWPTTSALFVRLGIASTDRCLDLGCGGGDVTRELARIVSAGFVVGTDLDATTVELARAETAKIGIDNAEFRVDDVLRPPADDQRFDVVYARFLFTHLPDPAKALERITDRVARGGVLVVEDIDSSGHFCYPPSPAFAALRRVVHQDRPSSRLRSEHRSATAGAVARCRARRHRDERRAAGGILT